ncbi:MAG TPA: AraC family transcriptional regulator [Spirochaetota bacterium]|nr:AraC family transcriptional regulator [Spirochaetota bacterium]HRZ26868.1 AraC family transcriptional regulator [Spirochaetota bacterium]HSA13938.1 AraC family transcriptional regulator [Spirochaetota bacterium]
MDLAGCFIYICCPASALLIVSLLVRSFSFRNIVLSLLVADLCCLALCCRMLETQEIFDYPRFFFTIIPAALLLGPLAYSYAQVVVEEKKGLDRQDWFHFIPFFASLIILFPFAADKPDRVREIIYTAYVSAQNLPLRMAFIAVMIVVPVYLGVIIRYAWPGNVRGNMVRMMARGMIGLLLAGAAGSLAGIAGLLSHSAALLDSGVIIIGAVVAAMYVLIQRFPFLVSHVVISGPGTWGRKQALSPEETANLEKHLALLMEEERFYRDESLSLSVLSEALEVAPHILARFLNDRYGLNYANFVNGFRVRDAERILIEQPLKNTLAVAYAVGFSSYNDFCSAFKRQTGVSPAEYRSKNVPQA